MGRPKKTSGVLGKIFNIFPLEENDKELAKISGDFLEATLSNKIVVFLVIGYLGFKYIFLPYRRKRTEKIIEANKKNEVKEVKNET